jgi:hypothetical protein
MPRGRVSTFVLRIAVIFEHATAQIKKEKRGKKTWEKGKREEERKSSK